MNNEQLQKHTNIRVSFEAQLRIEQLIKEHKMYSDWVNKLQMEKDELEHRIKMLTSTLEELDRDIDMLKFKVEPSNGSSIDRHFDRMRKTISDDIKSFGFKEEKKKWKKI